MSRRPALCPRIRADSDVIRTRSLPRRLHFSETGSELPAGVLVRRIIRYLRLLAGRNPLVSSYTFKVTSANYAQWAIHRRMRSREHRHDRRRLAVRGCQYNPVLCVWCMRGVRTSERSRCAENAKICPSSGRIRAAWPYFRKNYPGIRPFSHVCIPIFLYSSFYAHYQRGFSV